MASISIKKKEMRPVATALTGLFEVPNGDGMPVTKGLDNEAARGVKFGCPDAASHQRL